MSRTGLSYDDVVNAIQELNGQGQHPTIERIRRITRTGSNATIAGHFKKWKESQNSNSTLLQDNLSDELSAFVKGLWERLLEDAAAKIIVIEEKFSNEKMALQEELNKHKLDNENWQKLAEELKEEKKVLEEEKLTLQQALDFSHKEAASLNTKHHALLQQLQEKQDRIEELQRLHKQTQVNLEHYRQETREQRLLDLQQFENQKQQFQLEIKNLKSAYRAEHEKTISYQQRFDQLEQTHNELKESHTKITTQLHTQALTLEFTERQKLESLQKNIDFQKELTEATTLLENANHKCISIENENRTISHKLTEAKVELRNLQNQISALNQDKLNLVQTKSRLEGQLKQMQTQIA